MEKGVVFGNVSQQLLFVFSNFRLYKYFFLDYRKIPKISPGAYIFASLFFGGLLGGGAWEVMFKNVTFLAYKCFVMGNNN